MYRVGGGSLALTGLVIYDMHHFLECRMNENQQFCADIADDISGDSNVNTCRSSNDCSSFECQAAMSRVCKLDKLQCFQLGDYERENVTQKLF
jgi:hypothetical protein